jgi:hypothetical protein
VKKISTYYSNIDKKEFAKKVLNLYFTSILKSIKMAYISAKDRFLIYFTSLEEGISKGHPICFIDGLVKKENNILTTTILRSF